MATGKRASMREGPLAQLFRKTDEEEPRREEPREEREAPPREPRTGRPLPEDGPSPQATRRVPEPQAQEDAPEERNFEQRATEAARRAEERARRRDEEAPRERGWSRYEGVPSPEERLRSVFSSDIPENILERDSSPAPPVRREREPSRTARRTGCRPAPRSPSLCCAWSASAEPASTRSTA